MRDASVRLFKSYNGIQDAMLMAVLPKLIDKEEPSKPLTYKLSEIEQEKEG